MHLVQFIDGWILGKIEWASRLAQKLTGWDCLDQARFCYLLAGGFLLLSILRFAPSLPLVLRLGVGLIYALAAAFYLLLSAGAAGSLDDWLRSQAERGFRNRAKVEPTLQLMRLVMLLVCLALMKVPDTTQLYWAALGLYLRACDPLPPCRGKVREWLDNMKRTPQRAAT